MTSYGVIPGKCLPWVRLTCQKVHHIIVEYSIKYKDYKVFIHHNDWTFFRDQQNADSLNTSLVQALFSLLHPLIVPKEMLLLLISSILPIFSQMLFLQVTYSLYKAIFLPSSDISTALLLAKASLFLSAAARMCLKQVGMRTLNFNQESLTCQVLLPPSSWSWKGRHRSE